MVSVLCVACFGREQLIFTTIGPVLAKLAEQEWFLFMSQVRNLSRKELTVTTIGQISAKHAEQEWFLFFMLPALAENSSSSQQLVKF